MKNQEFMDKVKQLADQVYKDTLERAEKLTKSGAVDLDSYENDFRLPKNFIVANAKQIAWDYSPVRGADRKEIKNIGRFI